MTVCGEKVTGVCVAGKCPYFKRCHPVVWDKYGKIKPKTNEEWFCSLPTEEKAEVLRDMVMTDSYGFYDKIQYEEDWGCNGSKVIEGWLKQPHTTKE